MLLEQIGAELSVIKAEAWRCDWNRSLPYCRAESLSRMTPPTIRHRMMIYSTMYRGKACFVGSGRSPRISPNGGSWPCMGGASRCARASELATEALHTRTTGRCRSGMPASQMYSHPGTEAPRMSRLTLSIPRTNASSSGVWSIPWTKNSTLRDAAGRGIRHSATRRGGSVRGPRVDFLLSFPNGRCLVIEPGDHHAGV